LNDARARIPWLTLAFVAVAAVVSAWPAVAAALRFHREVAGDAELWRALTAQLVHGSPGLAAIDLGVVMLCGAWLEVRSRGLVMSAGGVGLLAVAIVVYGSPQVSSFEGSSGIACALLAAAALELALHSGSGRARALAWLAVIAVLAKAGVEQATGWSISGVGHLPEGVRVLSSAHLVGSLVGLASAALAQVLAAKGPVRPGLFERAEKVGDSRMIR
jgi:hypothetical protein